MFQDSFPAEVNIVEMHNLRQRRVNLPRWQIGKGQAIMHARGNPGQDLQRPMQS